MACVHARLHASNPTTWICVSMVYLEAGASPPAASSSLATFNFALFFVGSIVSIVSARQRVRTPGAETRGERGREGEGYSGDTSTEDAILVNFAERLLCCCCTIPPSFHMMDAPMQHQFIYCTILLHRMNQTNDSTSSVGGCDRGKGGGGLSGNLL